MTQSWPNEFTRSVGIEYPIIGGAMYPCSNPELIAAVSEAGGIGMVQPISLTYVYKYGYREGLEKIRSLTKKPIGVNLLIEGSSKIYMERMSKFLDESLAAGVKFYITALGNPDWVVKRVHAAGGLVYHNVTERKWAQKAIAGGVDGLVCVNNRAGGHAGPISPEQLFSDLKDLGKPLICAGGVGGKETFDRMLGLGYLGVQLGTRFIASTECRAGEDYKNAILKADASDIVLSERITGVPVSVINTPYVQQVGLKAGPIARMLLNHPKAKHWMRMWYSIRSFKQLKDAMGRKMGHQDYYQAGKSVAEIEKIQPVREIIAELTKR